MRDTGLLTMTPSDQALVPSIPPVFPASTPHLPPAISTPARRYGKVQDEGAVRQQWIEDATDTTCQIRPSTLTIKHLRDSGWFIQTHKHSMPFTVAENACALGYPNEPIYSQTLARKTGEGLFGEPGCENTYDMLIGKGILIAEAIFRSDGPRFSELARALLQRVTEPQSLRHFYVCDVVNVSTRKFVQDMLYSSGNNLEWPPRCRTPLVWLYNTPEYQGILGTRIGKCAAYLVLEIFPRGTHYIARIVTYDHACSLQMRFDIESIPSPVSG